MRPMTEAGAESMPARVLIVGCGLIGTSIGLALGRLGTRAMLTDQRVDHVLAAAEMGAGVAWQSGDAVDIVIVAVPPASTAAVITSFAEHYPHATITDVASVKGPIAAAAAALADRVIPGHPMAGRELSGPSAARADLFDDRLWILTPSESADQARLAQVNDMVTRIGAVPLVMSVHDHDEAVALVSHTPQVLASILAGQLRDATPEHVAIAGQGLRDMTRIAASNVDLWTEILMANGPAVDEILAAIQEQLDVVRTALASQPDGVAEILQRGVAGHQAIPGKHGALASPYVEVPVMVEDRPGQLAALLVAAGEAGINLEDVRIEHVLGRPSGLIELSVRPEHGTALVEVLRSRGFDVRA